MHSEEITLHNSLPINIWTVSVAIFEAYSTLEKAIEIGRSFHGNDYAVTWGYAIM